MPVTTVLTKWIDWIFIKGNIEFIYFTQKNIAKTKNKFYSLKTYYEKTGYSFK